ncbi:MAG: hypothetical protein GX921_02410 [Bacteroidales bacterium]|nr:hypothetical protein [Bacteroidales bacterium]
MYIFNPENDLALANFSPHYNAPLSALKMRSDLAMLPVWYAPERALVIAEVELNSKLLSDLKDLLPINSSLISYSQVADNPDCKLNPWGWSLSLRKEFMLLGLNEGLLPSIEDIELLRNYSSRENAVNLLKELREVNPEFCGASYYYTNVDELFSYLNNAEGEQVLKMPYSGSGRGIMWVRNAISDKQMDWCRRVVKKQGGVVVEPVLNKVKDFALEFEMTDKGVQFVGYSLFQSSPSGAYLGNKLLSDAAIEARLSTYIERSQLLGLKDTLKVKLAEHFPHYRGYLGVDMMVCKTKESTYLLQPCVEVNVRMNMGIVVHRIRERYVYPNSTGLFSINYFKQEGEALKKSLAMQADNPLVVEKGRVKSGYLALTPVCRDTSYVASVLIDFQKKFE